MEAIAKTKYLKGSPRKARLVIDLIRGQRVSHALSILRFTNKRAADPIAKTLRSAIANATYRAEQENIAIDPDDLWVKSCFVDMGPTKNRRRMRPAPQGRAYREQRHYCHITIEVTSDEKPKTEKEIKAEAAKAKAADRPKKAKSSSAKAAPKKAKKEDTEAKAAVSPGTTEAEAVTIEAPTAENLEAAVVKEDVSAADTSDASEAEAAESTEAKPDDEAKKQTGNETEKQ